MNDRNDIVSRLRWPPIHGADDHPVSVQLRIEAADEIERLRGAPAQGLPSKFSPGDPVEVRKQNDEIDEIVIRRGDVHIEQMSSDGWFMGVSASDGSYWQFWFGSKNRKSHVEFRHTETTTAQDFSTAATTLTSTDGGGK